MSKMPTNNGSPHLQIRHNFSGLYLVLHRIIIALTHCAQYSFRSITMWHFTELIGAHTMKNSFVSVLEIDFLKKLP